MARPRFRDAFLYLRGSDLSAAAALTTAGAAVGYFSALPGLRGRYTKLVAALGAHAGFWLCFQSSAGRLLGYKENEREVAMAHQVVAERERRAKVGLAAAAH
eukprot:CAMPEP_0174889812 /NCGR_PEP_ID=MMETSP0167-20121228/5009_1 /TAXON_ID=38298 /ORGANISM="Rhodella maculata, Strain CCMP736" /LENGTH=101 /DNA_ID=CAMNT_0016127345 /DNA_START=47 /DNA_END=352 /DNA_ORIENTATION=-